MQLNEIQPRIRQLAMTPESIPSKSGRALWRELLMRGDAQLIETACDIDAGTQRSWQQMPPNGRTGPFEYIDRLIEGFAVLKWEWQLRVIQQWINARIERAINEIRGIVRTDEQRKAAIDRQASQFILQQAALDVARALASGDDQDTVHRLNELILTAEFTRDQLNAGRIVNQAM